MIPLIVAVFLVLFFLVAVGLSIKTWRATQVTFVILTFLAAISLVVTASMSAMTRTTWMQKYAAAEKGIQQTEADGERLNYGDGEKIPWDDDSVMGLKQRLETLLLDRGRVWRHCTATPQGNGTAVVSTVPPNTPPEEIRANGIDQGTVLHAFKEHPVTGLPMIHLGEFQVVNAEEQAVGLQPTTNPFPDEMQQINEPNTRWTLYEIMPIDKHDAFVDEPRDGLLQDDQAMPLFGTMMGQQPAEPDPNAQQVAQQPPADPQAGNQQPGNQQPDVKMLTDQVFKNPFVALGGQTPVEYLKDGSPATEDDIRQFPENIWVKLEFQKAHKVRVDANNVEAGLTGSYFDANGFAVSPLLRIQRTAPADGAEAGAATEGGEVTFEPKEIVVFPYSHDEDRKLVDGLVSSGVCRKLDPSFFYVRNLRDYEGAFNDIREQYTKIMEDTARVNRDTKALETATQHAKDQTAFEKGERTDLQSDLKNFNRDNDSIGKLSQLLDERKASLRQELRNVFNMNTALNQQLTNIDQRVTEEINRRTDEAASQVQ